MGVAATRAVLCERRGGLYREVPEKGLRAAFGRLCATRAGRRGLRRRLYGGCCPLLGSSMCELGTSPALCLWPLAERAGVIFLAKSVRVLRIAGGVVNSKKQFEICGVRTRVRQTQLGLLLAIALPTLQITGAYKILFLERGGYSSMSLFQ